MLKALLKSLFVAAVICGFVWLGTAHSSQCPGITTDVSPIANSYEQITVSTTAVGLTVPLKAKIAVVTVESQPIRYRDDTTDPTDTVGVLVSPGATLIVCSHSLGRFKAIRQGGSDASLSVSYYGN